MAKPDQEVARQSLSAVATAAVKRAWVPHSWGQVLGTGSGLLRAAQGVSRRGLERSANSLGTGKTRREARLLLLADAPRNLHGKEGVDGSSPSEGFRERPANAGLLSSRVQTYPPLRVPDGYARFAGPTRNGPFSSRSRAWRSRSKGHARVRRGRHGGWRRDPAARSELVLSRHRQPRVCAISVDRSLISSRDSLARPSRTRHGGRSRPRRPAAAPTRRSDNRRLARCEC